MKRNTLAKQIQSQPTTEDAVEVAQHARKLTPIERATRDYLACRDDDGTGTAGFAFRDKYKAELVALIFRAIDCASPTLRRRTPAEYAAYRYNQRENEMANTTFEAQRRVATKTLRELADFVENFNPFKEPADLKRLTILRWKQIISDMGNPPMEFAKEMTIARLARVLKAPKTDDGYSTLRKLCREMGLKLAKSDKVNKFKKSASKP